jgi:hypothetical protein
MFLAELEHYSDADILCFQVSQYPTQSELSE